MGSSLSNMDQFNDDEVKLQKDPNVLYMIIVRHGMSYNNYMKQTSCLGFHRSASHIGWTMYKRHCDAPLTLPGRHQARTIGNVLASDVSGIYRKAIFSSQMERAIETALELNAGLRKVDKTYKNTIVPVPFFQEVTANLCISQPSEQRFKVHTDRTRTRVKNSFDATIWKKSTDSSGFDSLQSNFKKITLPWIKRQVGHKWAVLVGHGKHIRMMLNLICKISNAEPIFVMYNLKTMQFEYIWQMPMHVENVIISHNEVLALDDKAEVCNLYSDVCTDVEYQYPIFKPKPSKT